MQVLLLSGSPRERGRIHGETLREQIREMIALWKDNIRSDMGMDPDDFLQQLVTETEFMPAIKKWTPELLDEIVGIAEGSGVDFATIYARQLSDEEPWFRMEKKMSLSGHSQGVSGIPEKCTAIGTNPQGSLPAIAAQNMDTPAYYDGFQVLLHIKYTDSPLEVFMFTVAGKINLAGMSNAPVAICCNTVLPLDYSKDGLPEDFVVRGALEQPSLDDALAFVSNIKHASGQNYVIGGMERVLSLECSANKVVEYIPYLGANRVYHTNHPLVNDDQGIYNKRISSTHPGLQESWRDASGARTNTFLRFETLQRNLSDPEDVITIETIKSLLSSHEAPICFKTDSKISLGCLIMELSEDPKLHLAPGPPCSTPFRTHKFAYQKS